MSKPVILGFGAWEKKERKRHSQEVIAKKSKKIGKKKRFIPVFHYLKLSLLPIQATVVVPFINYLLLFIQSISPIRIG